MVPLSIRRLQQLCSSMGTTLHAGLDVRVAWTTEAKRLAGPARQRMLRMVDLMNEGDSLSFAIEQEGGKMFPAQAREMIRVGEQTGRLAEVFVQLGEHYNHRLELKRIVISGIAWPLFELSAAILAISILIMVFGMIDRPGLNGEPPSLFGLRGGSGVMTFLGLVALCLAPVFGCLLAVRCAWLPVDPILGLLSRIPMLGAPLKTMALSRICWTFSMAHEAGIDAERTVAMALSSGQNPVYGNTSPQILQRLAENQSFHDAFSAAGVFPHDFMAALQSGEIAGRLSETLAAQSDKFLERARQQFKKLAFVLGIVVFLAVGGLIVAAIFHMFFKFVLGPLNELT